MKNETGLVHLTGDLSLAHRQLRVIEDRFRAAKDRLALPPDESCGADGRARDAALYEQIAQIDAAGMLRCRTVRDAARKLRLWASYHEGAEDDETPSDRLVLSVLADLERCEPTFDHRP